MDTYEREPSGSLFCCGPLSKRGRKKIHGGENVFTIWGGACAVEENGAFSARGERRVRRLAKKGAGRKRKRQRNIQEILPVFPVC
ncbi:hypothetical protein DESPIG_02704 [Desulfovibrio piger ATCC 29098]|uniref:Uncharacterized protein n=1 Tax=Desulfovibrio piger ATCC 29098 TaxID=411464 RepID=B6WX78_9BACT|nr:hypothetical protein DESPIG_02704 [Desulfovibrio piger ATCC 29098]